MMLRRPVKRRRLEREHGQHAGHDVEEQPREEGRAEPRPHAPFVVVVDLSTRRRDRLRRRRRSRRHVRRRGRRASRGQSLALRVRRFVPREQLRLIRLDLRPRGDDVRFDRELRSLRRQADLVVADLVLQLSR